MQSLGTGLVLTGANVLMDVVLWFLGAVWLGKLKPKSVSQLAYKFLCYVFIRLWVHEVSHSVEEESREKLASTVIFFLDWIAYVMEYLNRYYCNKKWADPKYDKLYIFVFSD